MSADRVDVGGRAGWRRLAAAGVLAAGMAVLTALYVAPGLAEVPSFAAAPAVQACEPTGFLNANGEPVSSPELVRMNSNSYLRALVCDPSVLTSAAEGTAARGVGARLSVYLGTEALFDEPVAGAVELALPVQGPRWLVVAFTNDLYEPPEDRNLVLRDLRLVPLETR